MLLRNFRSKGTTIEEINAKFQSDLEKGYFKPVPEADINIPDCYYLNWFCVIDRSRATTKMRVVFDASNKDKFGKSLNTAIAKGPIYYKIFILFYLDLECINMHFLMSWMSIDS